MTRDDVLKALGQLAAGRLREAPPSWSVEEMDGRLAIEVDGTRYDVEVLPSAADHDTLDDMLGAMGDDERAAFIRDLEEAADEAEREEPVPADELRRSLDAAKESGLKVWNARHGIAD